MARRRGIGWAVVDADQREASNARTTRWDQARVDEDFVSAERVVATLVEGDAVRERLVRDGVVQVVGDAAVPGHVETRRL
jgi:hypothetical protein